MRSRWPPPRRPRQCRQPQMPTDQCPGEQRVDRQHAQVHRRHQPRTADTLQEEARRNGEQLEGIGKGHGAHHRGSCRRKIGRDPEQSQQGLREGEQNAAAREAEQQRRHQPLVQHPAGRWQVARTIRAGGEHQHARQPAEHHDDADEGQRPARTQRRHLVRACEADHDHVRHVEQRPVEAGEHHRPGERQQPANLGSGGGSIRGGNGIRGHGNTQGQEATDRALAAGSAKRNAWHPAGTRQKRAPAHHPPQENREVGCMPPNRLLGALAYQPGVLPTVFMCGRGGTGRRATLRSLWPKGRGSSSLLDRTTTAPVPRLRPGTGGGYPSQDKHRQPGGSQIQRDVRSR